MTGYLVVHLDFDKYGFELPEQPTKNRHYLGFDLNDPTRSHSILESAMESAEEISLRGQRWALDNYSPRAVANRFLKLIN